MLTDWTMACTRTSHSYSYNHIHITVLANFLFPPPTLVPFIVWLFQSYQSIVLEKN